MEMGFYLIQATVDVCEEIWYTIACLLQLFRIVYIYFTKFYYWAKEILISDVMLRLAVFKAFNIGLEIPSQQVAGL